MTVVAFFPSEKAKTILGKARVSNILIKLFIEINGLKDTSMARPNETLNDCWLARQFFLGLNIACKNKHTSSWSYGNQQH